MKMKRMTSLLLCAVLLLSLLPMQVFAAGTVDYILSSNQNTLEVSGSGTVTQADVRALAKEYKEVKELIIGAGVTRVEHNAFSDYQKLTRVVFKGNHDVVINGTLVVPVASIQVPAEYDGTTFGGKSITKPSGSTMETVVTVLVGQTHYIRIGTNIASSASSANPGVAKAEIRGENLKITGVSESSAPVEITLEKNENHKGGMKYKARVVNFAVSGPSVVDGGKPIKLTTNAPDASAKTTVTWSSSDTKVARVGSDGTVTAVGNGRVTITAKAQQGDFSATAIKILDVRMTAASNGGPYHQCEYSYYLEDGHTIAAKCSCGKLGMVSLKAPNPAYDGKEKNATVTGFEWPGKMPKIVYNETNRIKITGKDIVASITVENVTATITYQIVKADTKLVVTIADWFYGDTPSTPSVSGNLGNAAVAYSYKAKTATKFTSKVPTEIGTYVIKASIKETKNYKAAEATAEFRILKRDAVYTAPKAIEGLKFTGSPLALVEAGSVTHPAGKNMEYSLDKQSWSTNIPTATMADDYTVYWRIEGTDTCNGAAGEVKVLITDSKDLFVFENQALTITLGDSSEKIAASNKSGIAAAAIEGNVLTVTGVKASKHSAAEITVKNADGVLIAAYRVFVRAFEITPETAKMNDRETRNLTANTTADVEWKSDNEAVATVDSNGKVTAVKEGHATITATDAFGNKDTCKITVYKHKCDWTYSQKLLAKDTITATCDICEKTGTIKIVAPSDLIYNGQSKNAELVKNQWPEEISVSINYNNVNRTNVTGDEIEARIKLGHITAKVTYELQKAKYTYTAPTAQDLQYDGEAKALVAAGTVTGGKFEYKLGNQNWSNKIPQATNIGEYKVYWRITGNNNYENVDGYVDAAIKLNKTITLVEGQKYTIALKKEMGMSLDNSDKNMSNKNAVAIKWDHSGLEITGNKEGKAAVITIKKGNTVLATINVNVVKLAVTPDKVTLLKNDTKNLSANADVSVTWESNKTNIATVNNDGKITAKNKGTAEITVKAQNSTKQAKCVVTVVAHPTAKTGLSYNGKNQALISADGNALTYSLDGQNWSKTIPVAKNAGTYTVSYKVDGDSNAAVHTLKVTIAPKDITANMVSAAKNHKNEIVVTVKDGSTTLKLGEDFTISGIHTKYVEGKGNYSGKVKVPAPTPGNFPF